MIISEKLEFTISLTPQEMKPFKDIFVKLYNPPAKGKDRAYKETTIGFTKSIYIEPKEQDLINYFNAWLQSE